MKMIDTDQKNLVDEQLAEAVQEVSTAREKALALALYRDYDGVDILPFEEQSAGFTTEIDKFKMGFEWEGWRKRPPQRGRFEVFERYDFRQLTEREREMILSHIEVQE